MKKLTFLSTRPSVFLVELPPIILLIPSIMLNNSVNTLMKLYPLITVLSCLIIFFALYFFRAVSISTEEIRSIGLFSSRYKETIKEGRSLVLTPLKRKRIRVELYGFNDDTSLSYAWLKNEEPVEINLFRAKINGSKRQVKKILNYFGAQIDSPNGIFENEGDTVFESDEVRISVEKIQNFDAVRIYFKKTL